MFYRDNHATLYNKDCRAMSELPDESIHCCVTSPPYWGLRKYAGNQYLIWDGWRGQLGAEPTIDLYIQHIVTIFQEVKRVLRSDGVCFLNIGDSMASGKGTCGNPGGGRNSYAGIQKKKDDSVYPLDRGNVSVLKAQGLKPLDKCLIPFKLAVALQEDGWYVRQDIIWSKNNPMPESVSGPRWVKHRIKVKDSLRDPNKGNSGVLQGDSRHNPESASQYQDCHGCPVCLPNDGLVLKRGSWRTTRSHEYIFMLTKTDDYYCDGEAVREKSVCIGSFGSPQQDTRFNHGVGSSNSGINEAKRRAKENGGFECRNLHSVWSFPTQSYKGKHYATFPEKLPELCIKAGTPEYGVCAECGKPWARIIKTSGGSIGKGSWVDHDLDEIAGVSRSTGAPHGGSVKDWQITTLGWKPMCKCKTDKPPVPATVLDNYAGAGTTLYVASKLGRRSVGFEVSEEYCKLTVERLKQLVLV